MHVKKLAALATVVTLILGLAGGEAEGKVNLRAAPVVGKKGKKGKAITDTTLVRELRVVHHTLRRADPIYNGHRGKAMHEVNHAIGQLEKEMHKHGLKAHDQHIVNEGKTKSDVDLAKAAGELATILKQINGMASTNHRSKAAVHVAEAIKEIELGLAHVKKQKKKTT